MAEPKEDCIFYGKTGSNGCRALKELYCQKEDKPCGFYKSKGVFNSDGTRKKL